MGINILPLRRCFMYFVDIYLRAVHGSILPKILSRTTVVIILVMVRNTCKGMYTVKQRHPIEFVFLHLPVQAYSL
jgi:hypothetical protein